MAGSQTPLGASASLNLVRSGPSEGKLQSLTVLHDQIAGSPATQTDATLYLNLGHQAASLGSTGLPLAWRSLDRARGACLNVEYDYPVLRNAASGTQLNLVPFIDYGWARNTGGASATLASAGLAARMQWQKFNIDLVLAKRLKQDDASASVGASLQDAGIHLQVACKF